MFLIQIVLLLFCLFAIVKVSARYRSGDIALGWLVFWLLFWVWAGVVALKPDSTTYWARLLGVGRGADVVVYLSLALLFFLFFKLMVNVERINKDITKIVREITLNKNGQSRDIKH